MEDSEFVIEFETFYPIFARYCKDLGQAYLNEGKDFYHNSKKSLTSPTNFAQN
jgi:hypothetical protein